MATFTAAPEESVAEPSFAVEAKTGRKWTVGDGPKLFVIRVSDLASWRRLLTADVYDTAEAFVGGDFDIDGDVVAAVRWWYAHREAREPSWLVRSAARLRLESWFQSRSRARSDIEFHYDRSNRFYQQFLDRRLIYSCAYFVRDSMSIDDAQAEKLEHLVHKLDIRSGDRFLDVGCGWGGLVLYVAEQCHAASLGCTLSRSQFEFANEAVRLRGLDNRARFVNRDYRTLDGHFEKIASVGMYEHVGRHRLGPYFRTLARLMTANGLLLNSGIARPEPVTDDSGTMFLHRFVFPGGEIPYFAEVIQAAEKAGLEVLDVENLRRHYALTCASWVRRLQEHRDACLALVDNRTYRTWLLYLAASVTAFERGESQLYQILLAKRGRGTRQSRKR